MRAWISASLVAIACGALTLGVAGPVAGQGGVQPSFDCRQAGSAVERLICADPRLAAADRAVADAYAAALRRFDTAARTELQKDQRWFNAGRAASLPRNTNDRVAVLQTLLPYMVSRSNTLGQMTPPPGPGLIGRWQSAAGEVVIRSAGSGRVAVAVSAAAPGNARWLCEASGQAALTGTGMAQQAAFIANGWRITVRREGQLLRVTETQPAAGPARPYCGANGFVEGVYFPVPL